MQQDFYKKRLDNQYKINVLVPNEREQEQVHQVIYQELCLGKIEECSRKQFISIMENLKSKGCQGVILGYTEIGILISEKYTDIELYDSVVVHANAAIIEALR